MILTNICKSSTESVNCPKRAECPFNFVGLSIEASFKERQLNNMSY